MTVEADRFSVHLDVMPVVSSRVRVLAVDQRISLSAYLDEAMIAPVRAVACAPLIVHHSLLLAPIGATRGVMHRRIDRETGRRLVAAAAELAGDLAHVEIAARTE